MEPKWLHLETRRTARVALDGTPGPHIREVWVLLHGYRQLAASFIGKCAKLGGPDRLLVAPEGLSRFYLEGDYGRVGASWMTREDREAEIADQVYYLDSVLQAFPQLDWNHCRLHLLGFSQGVATAWRWLMYGKLRPYSVTLWAGRPPAETHDTLTQRLAAARVFLLYGDSDGFISPEAAHSLAEAFRAQVPHAEVHRYAGGHVLTPAALTWLEAQLFPSA